jgi:ATP-binding cassette, subfamily B, bacterial
MSNRPIQLITIYARKYTRELVIVALAMLALVGVQMVIPWVIRTLVAALTVPGAGIDALASINILALTVLGIYSLRAGLQFARAYLAHLAGWSVVADMRKYLYRHMQRLSLRFYQEKQIGHLMSNMVNDTDLFEVVIAHAIPDLVVNVVTLAAVTVVLFMLNWELALLSLIPAPIVLIALKIYARYTLPAHRRRLQELGDLNALLHDNLAGIREIKAFTREGEELERVSQRIDRYHKTLLQSLRLVATLEPFVDMTSSLGYLIVLYFGGRMALQGVLPVADLVAFFMYLDLLYSPLRSLSGAWENVQSALAGAERVADLLTEAEEQEPHNSKTAQILADRAQGRIVFNDVSFAYSPEQPVLENISLEIPAHSMVALVGSTGGGKSTLASLIPRFNDVTSGSITLDGCDLRAYNLDSLRQQIAIVLQDVFLFYGTVRDNLMFGRPNATEADMVSAARAANAHDFIMHLPNGYNTLIGERGVKLSGGQKQRLSIARAILKDAPILILDEATSAVDTETELLIQQALERLMEGRTTIVIAHRLSTIANADKIVVLEDHRISEEGTHTELMQRYGLYQKLFTIQGRLEPQSLR